MFLNPWSKVRKKHWKPIENGSFQYQRLKKPVNSADLPKGYDVSILLTAKQALALENEVHRYTNKKHRDIPGKPHLLKAVKILRIAILESGSVELDERLQIVKPRIGTVEYNLREDILMSLYHNCKVIENFFKVINGDFWHAITAVNQTVDGLIAKKERSQQ